MELTNTVNSNPLVSPKIHMGRFPQDVPTALKTVLSLGGELMSSFPRAKLLWKVIVLDVLYFHLAPKPEHLCTRLSISSPEGHGVLLVI